MTVQTLDHSSVEALGIWTGHHVKARLLEAYKTERRIPERKVNGFGSIWPSIQHDWVDKVHRNLPGDDERSRVWGGWAHSYDVSLMEEAFDWLILLANHRNEQDALVRWAKVTAIHPSRLRRELRKRGLAHATFYRQVTAGANRIADELNRQSVQVR